MTNTTAVKIITRDALNEKMTKHEHFQLLNVLEPKDYALGMIKGSRKIPLAELDKRFTELDKATEVVTYCAGTGCTASRKAAEMLAERGFKVSVYEGGIKDWTAANLPVEPAAAPVTAAPLAAKTAV